MTVMVLGATGLLGHALFRALAVRSPDGVIGTARSEAARGFFAPDVAARLRTGVDITDLTGLAALLAETRPRLVVNCTGARRPMPSDPMTLITAFALLPRQIAHLCADVGARLIQIGSDAVFSGRRGGYRESDLPDPVDAYGVAKLLGEATAPPALTIRTSMIGPELGEGRGLLAWFLAQTSEVRGHTRAVFSGLTSTELARVIRDVLLPRPDIKGVIHVAGPAISKHDLLAHLKAAYGAPAMLAPDDGPVSDRSLDAGRLMALTGYTPPDWPTMIAAMKADHQGLARS
jgi:dTDP-4-dehydrorhamnose reductase